MAFVTHLMSAIPFLVNATALTSDWLLIYTTVNQKKIKLYFFFFNQLPQRRKIYCRERTQKSSSYLHKCSTLIVTNWRLENSIEVWATTLPSQVLESPSITYCKHKHRWFIIAFQKLCEGLETLWNINLQWMLFMRTFHLLFWRYFFCNWCMYFELALPDTQFNLLFYRDRCMTVWNMLVVWRELSLLFI